MPTPNLNLEEATAGATSLEELITLFNTNMDRIDAHNHLSGFGRSVPLSALIGDSDLSMNSNDILQSQAISFLSGPNDSPLNSSVYFKNSDMFIRKGDGTVVQMTSGNRVAETTSPVVETSTVLYGYSNVQTTLSDDESAARAAATAAFAITSRRLSKTGNSVRTGCFIQLQAPASNGYYWPFVAIKNSEAGSITYIYDAESGQRDNQWVAVSSVTIGGTQYNLIVRKLPLEEGQSLGIVVRSFI